ncbi:MAG: hydantoinase B/oxoprolinase family protein, partial [Gammaproteobacteria bacterium]|nr:hydantoinase B/oxoprolinase family protein [Gammaproteobacteria bacterium]
PLYREVVEVQERLSAEGEVLLPLDELRLAADLRRLREAGIGSVAIVLIHGYRYPDHELRAAAIARSVGFDDVVTSHESSPMIRLVSRGDTAVVDAYLTPLLARYARQFRDGLGARFHKTPLQFMQSNGGLVAPGAFRASNAVLSGPAGGMVGTARAGVALARSRLIAFDMGGTSTDVALYDNGCSQRYETTIAGVRLQTPMMNIHTVAAGGGSVLHFEGGRLRVGPQSAGANPGPACYRQGGPLTVTDLQVLLGRIRPEFFPAVFGPRHDLPLDDGMVRRHFRELAARVAADTGAPDEAERLAAGFLDVAIETMARAIRHVSVRQGHDPADFALFCYGGAAPQHACRVAEALGIGEILIHPLAGVLSAWGIGLADRSLQRRQSIEQPLTSVSRESLAGELDAMCLALRDSLIAQGANARALALSQMVELRAPGTETAIGVALDEAPRMLDSFSAAFRQRFGFLPDLDGVIVATLRAQVTAPGEAAAGEMPRVNATRSPAQDGRVRAWFDGWHEVPALDRAGLSTGDAIAGPALIVEPNSTTVVEPGWVLSLLEGGELKLVRDGASAHDRSAVRHPDPALLEIYNHRFMQVAEQMGAVLQATAVSVNIRERLDFSCALFDSAGALIANAPHMPVHLGSMGASVRAVIERNSGQLRPERAWMLNAPYAGGTHLPDITVVSPVFTAGDTRPAYFVASRAHHADIGGITPGSMPPASRHIDEEGVLIDNFLLVDGGRLRERELRGVLASGSWPARNPDQNVADLKAQLAANSRGVSELGRLIGLFGRGQVDAYMGHVQDNADACVQEVIGRLSDGHRRYELDDGSAIEVAVRI